MPRTIAIITAGGTGKRMKSSVYKQFIQIQGIPILAITIKQFELNPEIDGIIITSPGDALYQTAEDIVDRFQFKKVLKIVEGGSERQFSVWNALKATPGDTEFVLIHDGVRPFVSQKFLDRIIQTGYEKGACIPALKPSETVKQIADHQIKSTLDRDSLILVQTPQMFRMSEIREAYEKADLTTQHFTDDSAVMEKLNSVP
ncbi:MAG: 2-C-methyl-D-erythritol 4-phosphate cytidylyltransferase, partial [Methanobacteriota archaeon]